MKLNAENTAYSDCAKSSFDTDFYGNHTMFIVAKRDNNCSEIIKVSFWEGRVEIEILMYTLNFIVIETCHAL